MLMHIFGWKKVTAATETSSESSEASETFLINFYNSYISMQKSTEPI